jgi:hypothetical protein
MVSPRFQVDDTQDHGEREGCFCTRDGAQNAGLGGTFGGPLASEGEARRSEHRQENSDHGRKDAHSAIKLRAGVDQLLPVLVERFDGDDRALPSSSPGGNSRARDPDVLGQASGAGPDDLGAKAVVVCVACPGRGRGGVYQGRCCVHGSATCLRTQLQLARALGTQDRPRSAWPSMLFWQVAVNIGMVTGLLPVIGVTLPLISYGGSSALTVMLALGLVMNVSVRRFAY